MQHHLTYSFLILLLSQAEWDGNKERKCYITTKTKIGDHIVALPSSYITAYCAIYGPLLYLSPSFIMS
jgi:hypothetical protein